MTDAEREAKFLSLVHSNHYVDIVIRKDGKEYRYEGDYIKQALKKADANGIAEAIRREKENESLKAKLVEAKKEIKDLKSSRDNSAIAYQLLEKKFEKNFGGGAVK